MLAQGGKIRIAADEVGVVVAGVDDRVESFRFRSGVENPLAVIVKSLQRVHFTTSPRALGVSTVSHAEA
jgi:hypothetical protein